MKESLHPEVQFSLEAGLVNPRDIRERMQGIVTYKAQDQRTGEPVFVKQALVPEAKKHITYAVVGAIIGFGAQAIVDLISSVIQ